MAEEKFNNFSLEERGKFDEETLVNVNNLRKRMMGVPKSERFNNEYIVVRAWIPDSHFSFFIAAFRVEAELYQWNVSIQKVMRVSKLPYLPLTVLFVINIKCDDFSSG
jgi:hypothetical protein